MKLPLLLMFFLLISCEVKLDLNNGAMTAPAFSFPTKVEVGNLFGEGTSSGISATAIDKENNVYVSLSFSGPLDGVTSEGKDIALLKFDSKGNLLWKRHLSSLISTIKDSSQDEDVTTLLFDEKEQALYFIGITKSSFIENNSTGNSDVILGKLSSKGNVLWLKHYGEATKNVLENSLGLTLDLSQNEGGGSIRLSPQGNLTIAFYTGGSFFEPSAGGDDLVVMVANPSSGNIIKGRQLGSITLPSLEASGEGNERHTQGSFAFDGNKIVVPFWTSGSLVEANTNWDAGYVVLSENLDVEVIKQLGTATYGEWVNKGNYSGTVNGHDQFRSLVVLSSGDYLFYGKTDSSLAEQVNGVQDIFFARYKNNELVSLIQHGATTVPTGTNSEEARIITRDERGNIYCSGHTRSPLFEPITGKYWTPFIYRVDENGGPLGGIQLGNTQAEHLELENLYYTLIPSYGLSIKDGRIVTGFNDQPTSKGASFPRLWSFPAP